MKLNKSTELCPTVIVLLFVIATVNFTNSLESETWWYSKLGIFILVSTVGTAESQGTNPLSRMLHSNSTVHPESTAATMRVENKMLNITLEGNNTDISYSNSSRLAKKPSRQGKQRRFRIKQFSQPGRKSRPYFHESLNSEMKKSRTKKDRQTQSVNFDEGLQAESLKMKILSRLGGMDPLLCLPKALCGISSSREMKIRLQALGTSQNGVTADDSLINNYLEIMKTVLPKNDKVNNNKQKRKNKMRDNDLNSSEESGESASSSPEEPLDQDDLEHMKEKARVEKWMREDEFDPDPNWWDILPPNRPYYPIDEISQQNDHSQGSSGSWSTFSPTRISKGLTSFFGSILPSMSWGLGTKPDVFADDPFFTEFRSSNGRSMSDGVDKRSFGWLFGKTDSVGQSSGMQRNGRRQDSLVYSQRNKNKKNKNKNRNRRKKSDELNMIDDDPLTRFQLAVEIGKQMENPTQCNYIFTGCPFSYLEIIDIIESSKKDVGLDSNQHHTLNILGVDNNSSSTNNPGLQPDDILEVSLKIADKNIGTTLVPQSAILRDPSDNPVPTILTMNTTPSNAEKFQLDSQPYEDESFHVPSSHQKWLRTALHERESHNRIEEDDSIEHNLPPHKRNNPLRTKSGKRRRSKGPPRINNRKQWGSKHLNRIVKQTPPTILRQSQVHSHTKYKHIPLPTTINKPSHVINYHFHNTNTHPQLHHNPQQLSVHSYPSAPSPIQPPYNYNSQQSLEISTQRTTTTTQKSTPTQSPRDSLKPKRQKRRRRYKSKIKQKKPVSEERIVIQFPEPTQSPNNNYYNLYPLLNGLYNSAQQPQGQNHEVQSYHQNQYFNTPIPSRHPSSPQQPHYYPQQGFQPHQSYPVYPHSPLLHPGIFSYALGKK